VNAAVTISYDRNLPVLIFKCGYYPLHAGSLAVVRSFGRVGVPVYGTYEDRFSPAAWSRYLTGKFVWRAQAHDTLAVLDELREIGRKLGRRPLLLPTDDLAAILVAENAETLRPHFRFPEPPHDLPRAVANKRRLFDLCEQHGIPRAKSTFIQSACELDDLLRTATFPLIVKVAEAWRLDAVPSTSLAPDAATAHRLFDSATLTGCRDLIFQEYIPSDGSADWFFHGYSNSSGQCLVAFTGRKLRSCPAGAGRTAYCCTETNAEVRRQAGGLISAISFSGIVDLDFRFDSRDGTYKLLDFNPRLGAQFSVFKDANDVDVVRAMHLDISGREVPRAEMRSRFLIIEDLDLRVAFRYRKFGASSLRAWLSEIRSASEYGWYARDDLRPLIMMTARNAAHFMRKLLSRLKFRMSRRERDPQPHRGDQGGHVSALEGGGAGCARSQEDAARRGLVTVPEPAPAPASKPRRESNHEAGRSRGPERF
jgi:predicted ATP-grasp superfamily ATP-dependent carboligase